MTKSAWRKGSMVKELLEKLALALEAQAIPYMVIGGQAVLLYGEPRLTRDIDITLGTGPEGLPLILNLVQKLKLRVLVETPSSFVQETMVLPCLDSSTGMRVDFIFSTSAYEREALGRVRRVTLGKAEVCFASLEDVIVHKIIAGRPRDLEDVKNMLIKNPTVDLSYLNRCLEQFEQMLAEPFRRRLQEILEENR